MQAAVDVLLPQLCLSPGAAHFTGRVFGIFSHFLHGVGHFVNGGRHLLHLQGLMLTTLLRLAGIVAKRCRGLFERRGCALQLADYRTQFVGEGIEMMTQLGDFIAAMGVEATGQIAFTTGNIGHGQYGFSQRANDTAGYQNHQRRHHQCNTKACPRSFPGLRRKLGLHVVDINPGANDPPPRLEQLHIRSLLHRFLCPRFWPTVIDDALAFGFSDSSHLTEQRDTVGIFDGRHVFAIELGIGGVHDHKRPQVVDPEVVVMVIAQLADHGECLLLRDCFRQCARSFQTVVIGENTADGLHDMAGFLRFTVIQVVMYLLQHQHAQCQQHGH